MENSRDVIKRHRIKKWAGVFFGLSSLADATTVHELLERYRSEILPAKRTIQELAGPLTILKELGQLQVRQVAALHNFGAEKEIERGQTGTAKKQPSCHML